MAVSDVSTAYKDAVRAFLKSFQYLVRSHRCGTQSPDGPHIWRILKSTDSGKISAGVCAPIAQKTKDYRFKLFRHIVSCSPETARLPRQGQFDLSVYLIL